MKRKHAFTPSLDGKLESRLALNAARPSTALPTSAIRATAVGEENGAFSFDAILATGDYNGILVNIHKSTVIFGRSRGTPRDDARLNHGISPRLGRLPYARYNGLISDARNSPSNFTPEQSRELYADIRSTMINHIGDMAAIDAIRIVKPSGHFSDGDIFGPQALINRFTPV